MLPDSKGYDKIGWEERRGGEFEMGKESGIPKNLFQSQECQYVNGLE